MSGGVSCCEQVEELAVGFQAVHCWEAEHLDNGKVSVKFWSVCSNYSHIQKTIEFAVKSTQNQEPEWVCLREEPGSLTLSPDPDKTVFKDKFIFVRDMKHSLTLVFGTVLIG